MGAGLATFPARPASACPLFGPPPPPRQCQGLALAAPQPEDSPRARDPSEAPHPKPSREEGRARFEVVVETARPQSTSVLGGAARGLLRGGALEQGLEGTERGPSKGLWAEEGGEARSWGGACGPQLTQPRPCSLQSGGCGSPRLPSQDTALKATRTLPCGPGTQPGWPK